ncbi:conserved hypothetical protein, partial [Trichinella spiralis]|uniref:hypothetical protein n=1 Tax=Trichinella spiralis TaxID=6334 RepID=UPI0001EFE2AA
MELNELKMIKSGFLFFFSFIAKLEFEGDNSGELEEESKSAVFSHSLYFARDEMAAEYDELLQQVEHFQMMNFLDNAIQLCVWLCACRFRRIRMMLKECVGFLTKLTYCGVTSLKPMQNPP